MQVVIGAGEVGKAVFEVLSSVHECIIEEWHYKTATPDVDCLHICFPWYDDGEDDNFIKQVKEYREIYNDSPVVVHSTVPVGTCAKIGCAHSPIRGVHPNLAEGIRTFTKYFSGPARDVSIGAGAFFECGVLPMIMHGDSRVTEAGKLWSTTQYGVSILVEKAIHEYCERNNMPFDEVYTMFNESYNGGYRRLGVDNVQRPNLRHVPGPIGGHCIIPNAELLEDPLADWLIERNNEL